VRLLLGDTDVDNPRLTDVEITYFLTKAQGVAVRGAYLGAQALVAKYSQKLTAYIGTVARIDYRSLVMQYQELLRMLAAAGGRPGSQLTGPPVDSSATRPSVIANVDWRNNRSW
jgi:hypothetical protein